MAAKMKSRGGEMRVIKFCILLYQALCKSKYVVDLLVLNMSDWNANFYHNFLASCTIYMIKTFIYV